MRVAYSSTGRDEETKQPALRVLRSSIERMISMTGITLSGATSIRFGGANGDPDPTEAPPAVGLLNPTAPIV